MSKPKKTLRAAAKKRALRGSASEHHAVLAQVKRNAREQLAELRYASTCDEQIELASSLLETAGALTLESRHGRLDPAGFKLAAKLRVEAAKSLRSCLTRKP